MTKRDFEAAIRVFLRELSPTVLSAGEESFAHLELRREVREARRTFGDAGASDALLLASAVGLVEEYVSSDWDRVVKIAFEAFESDRRA
ncbi:MAG: hypothetical protein KF709_11260 [Gemmatimonadaceae bacterium]|nr:hypothetical protein [Gemmatimonadaceae bacterium]